MRAILEKLSIAMLAMGLYAPVAHAYLGDALFLPPHADYQQFETEHFVIVFPADYAAEARETADAAEDVHRVLTQAFRYTPDHKCHLILTDNQDFANGVTTPLGHQGIVLYLIPPEPYTSLGEYDLWLRHLIMHEYAHYVTLTQARGIFELGQYLFGQLLYPNVVWPTWISEGMAVYAESVFTEEGRGHGTYYSTLTRDALAHDRLGTSKFLMFEQLTGPVPDFPFGESHYYAGYAMIDQMIVKNGDEAPARFAEESSWRLPFLNDGTLENIARDKSSDSASFEGLWSGWIDHERRLMGPDLEWLKRHGTPEPRLLTPEGTSAVGSRLSPDGKQVAYARSSGHERPALFVADAATGDARRLEDAIAGAGLAWSPDSRRIYYAKADYAGPYAFYSDLYEWNLDGGRSRLTHGERAKDPDRCRRPDGAAWLIYAQQRGRVSRLKALDLGSGSINTIYTAPDDHHLANPRCSPDGRTVYFSEHGAEPRDAMMSVPLAPGNARARHLFGGGAAGFAALFPEPLPNGDLYFTRVVDDYYELARWDARASAIRLVARGTGGYWLPSAGAPDKDGRPRLMSVSYVASSGIRVGLVDPARLESASNESGGNRPDNRADPEPRVAAELKHEPERLSPRVSLSKTTGYSLLGSLQPRIWAPFITLTSNEDQFGAELLGWDDLDQLEYTVLAWYDTVPRKPEGIFSTFHRLETFRIGLAASSQVSAYAIAGNGTREYDEERKLTLSVARPFPGVFERFTPTVLAEWARTYQGGDFGAYTFTPDERLGLELTYDNRASYNYSITPESGVLLDANGRRFFSNPGQAWKGLLTVNPIVPLWPRHANLSLNAIYGVAPQPVDSIPESALRVGGRGTASDLDPALRGFPLGNFSTKRAAIIQAEYRIPIAQVFQGYGTWPLFLNNLGLYGFYDGAKLERTTGGFSTIIDSAGGGLILNPTVAYSLPLQIRVEFAHGFQQRFNGQNVLSANLQL